MFCKFLWGKVEWLKRLKVIKKDSEGGLGMVDLDSLFNSFKAVWVSRIMKADPENDNWVQIPILLFSKLGGLDKDKDKDKDLFIGQQEFVVGYSKAPEQPQSSARPICHSHTMTRTGREPATVRIAA